MDSLPQVGRLILLAEDEAIISSEIEQTFTEAGFRVRVSETVEDALLAVEDLDLAAGIVNHLLADGESSRVCERLKERHVPFVLFSGFTSVDGACRTGISIHKPATSSTLLSTVCELIRSPA
jgi:DNA-binding response OmpR family regulator